MQAFIVHAAHLQSVDSRGLSGGEYIEGIYLGEILRLTGGGSWMKRCIVHVGDTEISPVEKVGQFVRSPATRAAFSVKGLGEFPSLACSGHPQMRSRRVTQRTAREQSAQVLVTELASCKTSQVTAFECGDCEAVLEQ